jgi:hypothetical protein
MQNPSTKETLIEKYRTVLDCMNQNGLEISLLYVKERKLFVKATSPNQESADQVWDEIQIMSPNNRDLVADISVRVTAKKSIAASH